jgi:hypothetical protein
MIGGMAVAASLGMPSPQVGGLGIPDPTNRLGRTRTDDEEPIVAREMQRNQEKRLMDQRQQEVVSDTAKLLQLATNLKAEVDKQDHDTVPVDAIKEADEIGKLAKKVSDKIKAE